MKVENIIGTGSCGIEVRLNIADQLVLTHTIKRIDAEHKKAEEYNKWQKEYWNIPAEEREAWKDRNPRPDSGNRPDEEYHKLYIFCKKLILKDGCDATIFDEEDEQAKQAE